MTIQNKWIPGDHYVICDYCGFKKRRSEVRKDWKGFMACKEDFSLKHPQLSPGSRKSDRIMVRNARPDRKSSITSTKLAADAAQWATSITVAAGGNINTYEAIGVEVVPNTTVNTASAGTYVHWTVVTDATGVTISLLTPMPELSLASAVVWTPGVMDGDVVVGTTEVLATNY
jgi:hypothetical protein